MTDECSTGSGIKELWNLWSRLHKVTHSYRESKLKTTIKIDSVLLSPQDFALGFLP